MAEIETDAKAVLVNYVCDICGSGLMQCVDHSTMKDDNGDYYTIYTHKCNNCDACIDITGFSYPYTKFIPVNNTVGD